MLYVNSSLRFRKINSEPACYILSKLSTRNKIRFKNYPGKIKNNLEAMGTGPHFTNQPQTLTTPQLRGAELKIHCIRLPF